MMYIRDFGRPDKLGGDLVSVDDIQGRRRGNREKVLLEEPARKHQTQPEYGEWAG